MHSSLQHSSSLQHLAELRRSADEQRATPRASTPVTTPDLRRAPRSRRGLRALRPAH